MIAVLATAWRVILMRTRADWLILSAATLIILLATTLLSAGPIYAGAVAVSGLHRTLEDAPLTESNVQISARLTASEFPAFNETVIQDSQNAFRFTGATVVRSGRSDSFALPDQRGETVTDLSVFTFQDDIENHATILEGSWPAATAGAVLPSAISESAADILGITLGDELTLESRRERGFLVTTRVDGIYRINDPSHPLWWEDELDLNGLQEGQSFDTFGPFVVTEEAFFSQITTTHSLVRWRVYPVWTNLKVRDVPTFRATVEQMEDRLNGAFRANNRINVDTTLPRILRDAERSLLVTRTGVLILTLQLAILAGYALVLTAGLLIEQRRVETSLLRSRGGASGQIGAMAFMEGLVLALPAAILGPWIAALSLRLLNVVGPLTTINLTVEPEINRAAYALSGVSALACVVALTLPAYFSARSFIDARTSAGRQQARGVAQRAGIDLALIVVAALGYWQLRRYGAPITESVQGRLGLDPFLVAAPAIGLLAGAVIALRVIPLLARVIDRLVITTKGLVPSLGAWQVSRRPARYARSALLLILAMAIGLFAVSYTSTWTLSQEDQANFQTGADIRIAPDRRVTTAIPPLSLGDAHTSIPGVTMSMPVHRETMTVSRSAGTGRLLSVDAAVADGIVAFREDLATDDYSTLMQRLHERRPSLEGVELAGEPQRLALEVGLSLDELPGDGASAAIDSALPRITVFLQDARGMIHSRTSAQRDAKDWDGRFEVSLVHDLENGALSQPDYPVSIVGVDVQMFMPPDNAMTGLIALDAIEISMDASGDTWTALALEPSAEWRFGTMAVGGLVEAPTIEAGTRADRHVTARFSSGIYRGNNRVTVALQLRPGPAMEIEALAAVVSDVFLTATETAVGDRIPLDVGGVPQTVEIVGSVAAFPTLDERGGGILLMDLPTISMLRFTRDSRVVTPGEWWLTIDESQRDSIVSTLRTSPYSSSRLFDRVDRAETLRTDPVALGIIGALSLGFVASAAFAVIGFVVSASVSARERITEFALLRALGLSPRQLSGWLSLENGLLVGVSLVGGTMLGLALAWMVLPFVTLTQGAAAVVPGIIVQIPWRTVVMLEIITVATLAFVVAISGMLLRRTGLGSVLRLGED